MRGWSCVRYKPAHVRALATDRQPLHMRAVKQALVLVVFLHAPRSFPHLYTIRVPPEEGVWWRFSMTWTMPTGRPCGRRWPREPHAGRLPRERGGAAWGCAGRLRRRGRALCGRRHVGARTQRLAERDQGDRELVRQRRVRPAVGMRERNELPHAPLQGRPLGRHLPLGRRLRRCHLAPGLRLGLGPPAPPVSGRPGPPPC